MTAINAVKASDFPDDARLREILKDAHLPSLLGALAYAAHDLSLLKEEFRPNYIETAAGFQPQGGLSADAQEKARAMAFDVIQQLRKDTCACGMAR
jgi:4-hydroxyacetophenone monooxygenase